MDWEFIVHHLISGYIPVSAALGLYFMFLHVFGKRQTAAHIIASFVFCFYLTGILSLSGICFRGSFSPSIVWIPFMYMITGPLHTVLNILLFVPMGVFLPLLYREFNGITRTAAAGFTVSLSVEIAQMFGTGTTDINDLITNTLGACIGYIIFRQLYKTVLKSQINEIRAAGIPCFPEFPLFWAGSILIMLTVQTVIYHALF